jgi:hypothetical protein
VREGATDITGANKGDFLAGHASLLLVRPVSQTQGHGRPPAALAQARLKPANDNCNRLNDENSRFNAIENQLH